MSEHTPGPWVGFSDQGKCVAIMPAGREGDICTFQQPPSDADARLMTLAPALLKALRPLAGLYFLIDDLDADPDGDVFMQHDGCVVTYGDIRKAKALLDAVGDAPQRGDGTPLNPGASSRQADSASAKPGGSK